MNVVEINPHWQGGTANPSKYVTLNLSLTVVTFWIIIAFQSKYIFPRATSFYKRLVWPIFIIEVILRKRLRGKFQDQPPSIDNEFWWPVHDSDGYTFLFTCRVNDTSCSWRLIIWRYKKLNIVSIVRTRDKLQSYPHSPMLHSLLFHSYIVPLSFICRSKFFPRSNRPWLETRQVEDHPHMKYRHVPFPPPQFSTRFARVSFSAPSVLRRCQ